MDSLRLSRLRHPLICFHGMMTKVVVILALKKPEVDQYGRGPSMMRTKADIKYLRISGRKAITLLVEASLEVIIWPIQVIRCLL